MSPSKIEYWIIEGEYDRYATEAEARLYAGMSGKQSIAILGFAPHPLGIDPSWILDLILENLDDEWRDDPTDPTSEMLQAAADFAERIEKEYGTVYQCLTRIYLDNRSINKT